MNLSFYKLSKDQTSIIKAIAMICLVLHNFLHVTNDIGENELVFDANRIFVLFGAIKHMSTMFFNALFSYFGFYALELFIFISGYGLAKQYCKDDTISYQKYLIPKLVKLYSLLTFGIILYLIFFSGNHTLRKLVDLVVSTMLMYNNFSFERIFMYIGPW